MPMTPTPSRTRRASRSPEAVETVLSAVAFVYAAASPTRREHAVELPTERIASRVDLSLPVVQSVLRAEVDAIGARLDAVVEYVCAPPHHKPRHKPYLRVTPPGAAEASSRVNAVVGVSLPGARRAERSAPRALATPLDLDESRLVDPDFDELEDDGPW